MNTVLSCRDISVKYESGFAVQNVSLTVEQGDYLCIVGENGSGKTTLMKTLLGLIRPHSGKVEYTGVKPAEIGFIPQQTVVQKDFPTSVFEVVLSGCQNRRAFLPFYRRGDKARAKAALCRLNAEDLMRKSYRDLSGGQQQRVLLARALCATEKLLLLDEPAAGLDPVMAGEMYRLLEELNRQGITVIMISHDIAQAVKYAGKILHMKTSALFFGTAQAYTQSETGRRMMGGEQDV